MHRFKARRRRALLAAVPLGLLAALMLALTAGATLTGSDFESHDGNLANNGVFDWNDIASVTYTGTAPYRQAAKAGTWQFKAFEDADAVASDTGFAGGVKQDNDCGTTKDGKAPNKDDLNRIYIASKTGSNGHTYLNLAWSRIRQNSDTASAHVGYEFNQGKFVNSVLQTCGGSPNLVRRKGGDMLVVYDFEGGSAPVVVKVSRWLKTGESFAGQTGLETCEVNNSTPAVGCWGGTQIATDLGWAEGKVSTETVTDALKPSGANDPGKVEFGEAGLDLTAAGIFTANTCASFGKAYAVSRSSGSSSQAAMEDIVGPGDFTLTNCGTVTVNKSTNDSSSPAGAVFTLYKQTLVNNVLTYVSVGTCTTSSTGACTGSLTVGTASFANLLPGNYKIDETTVPTGYTKDGTLPEFFALTAGQNKSLSYTNTRTPGDVAITKVDDAGAALNGATLEVSQGGVSKGSCQTAGSGTCTISGLVPGVYSLDESVVPAGYEKGSISGAALPQNVTVTAGGTTQVTVTDPRKFKMIVIVCKEASSTLYSSSVSINSDVRPVSLATAPSGITEATLCGLTAGAKSGLTRAGNNHSATVTIP